ncbi:MAG: DUF1919 domain-containing protein [Oscillospiraceae bacterium]|nr:DUF1919 domain-containing protein [Oscillospiraceae bacterium]
MGGTPDSRRLKYIENEKKRLVNRSFSLFTNNCLAVRYCIDRGLRYNSPTMSLFMLSDSYLNFLENLPHYLTVEPIDYTNSDRQILRHLPNKIAKIMGADYRYPLGRLDDSVLIHFNHYLTFADAREKWVRRCGRVDMNNIFVIMSELFDCCNGSQRERFLRLPYPKIYFALKPVDHPDAVNLSAYRQLGDSVPLTTNTVRANGLCPYENFDLTAWLNARGTLRARDILQGKTI